MTKRNKRQREEEDNLDESQKPLKLVLKVGGHVTPAPSPASQVGTEDDTPERRHKKKKKRRKEKRRGRDEDDAESELDEDSQHVGGENDWKMSEDEVQEVGAGGEVPSKRSRGASVASSFSEGDYAPARNLRERKTDGERKSLILLLDYLQRVLSRKDVNGFFQFPVTDVIAPRYSEIIAEPMDFSTMKTKIDTHEYSNVREYKADFRRMLENCMAYNHPDTIFHKEAQRLLNIGLKQLSKEKLLSLRRSLPGISELSEEDLGLCDEQQEEEELPFVEYKKPRKGQMSKYEAIVDDATPEEILAQVQQAARNAAEELQARKPESKMGYLVKKKEGSMYLNFLNPENTGILSEKEKIVTLGKLTDKLGSGTGSLAAFKEDKRNKAIPLSYLSYGPFSSYAPVYDSTTCNLSKAESDLLLSTYGDDTGIQYSKSIREFVDNAGDYATQMVDNLLGLLTGGHHFKTMQYMEQKDAQKEEESKEETEANEDTSLQSLSNLGIDMSFLDSMGPTMKSTATHTGAEPQETQVQSQLDQTAKLLTDLGQVQHDRLSSKPPVHLSQLQGPTDTELRLAEKVTEGLTGLVKQVGPSDVFNVTSNPLKQPTQMGTSIELKENQSQRETSPARSDSTLTAPLPGTAASGATNQQGCSGETVLDLEQSFLDNTQEVTDLTQDSGGDDLEEGVSSSQEQMDAAEQLLRVQFSQEMVSGFSPVDSVAAEPFSVSTEEGESFNVTNGMDSNETEAAVAGIL